MALPIFKSFRFFLLDDARRLAEQIEDALTKAPTHPITPHQAYASGFVQTYAPYSGTPVLRFIDSYFFRLHVQSRKINKDAVKRLAAEKVEAAAERQETLEEKTALELALQELMPTFPVTQKYINAALSVDAGRLFVEGTDSDVDLLVSRLRTVVETMPGRIYRLPNEFAYRASSWIQKGVVENGLLLGDEAAIEDNENAVVTFKKMKLHQKNVIAHLQDGFRIKAISLGHPEELWFSLNKKGVVSKIGAGEGHFLEADKEIGEGNSLDPMFIVIMWAMRTISSWLLKTFPPEADAATATDADSADANGANADTNTSVDDVDETEDEDGDAA